MENNQLAAPELQIAFIDPLCARHCDFSSASQFLFRELKCDSSKTTMATFGSSGNYKLLQLRMVSLPPEGWQESYKNYQEIIIIHQDSFPNTSQNFAAHPTFKKLIKSSTIKKKKVLPICTILVCH